MLILFVVARVPYSYFTRPNPLFLSLSRKMDRGCQLACFLLVSTSHGSRDMQQKLHDDMTHFASMSQAQHQGTITMETFVQAGLEQRNKICGYFSQLKEHVESSERQALAKFDARIAQILKRMQVKMEALEVYVVQASACVVKNVSKHAAKINKEIAEEQPPMFHCVETELVRTLLDDNKLWSFGRMKCQLIESMQHVIHQQKDAASTEALQQLNACAVDATPLEAVPRVVTVDVETGSLNNEVAVDLTNDVFAMSCPFDNEVSLFTVSTCKKRWSEGSYGIASLRFNSPRGLCFVNGNLMVADFGNARIQEISKSGVHTRSIVISNSSPQFVDGNSDVIVVCSYPSWHVSVLDYISMRLEKAFQPKSFGGACSAMKLTPDGKSIVFSVRDIARILLFTLSGECIKDFRHENSSPRAVCFLPSGQMAVAGSRWTDAQKCFDFDVTFYLEDDELQPKLLSVPIPSGNSVTIASVSDCLFAFVFNVRKSQRFSVNWS